MDFLLRFLCLVYHLLCCVTFKLSYIYISRDFIYIFFFSFSTLALPKIPKPSYVFLKQKDYMDIGHSKNIEICVSPEKLDNYFFIKNIIFF